MTPPPATPQEVALASLRLTDFRNYASAGLAINAGLVVLTGPNGSGKTNLLEAVSFLSPGRGLRRARLAAVCRTDGAGGWAVAAEIDRGGERTRLGTGLRAGGPETSREVRIDGAGAPSSEALLEYCRILWLTPAMDGLFTGTPGDRRRFLDRLTLAVDPGHGTRVRAFDKLLSSRNRLLEEDASARWLSAVEAELSAAALAVSFARRETVSLLAGLIAGYEEGPFPVPGLALEGEFEEELVAGSSAAGAEDAYREKLESGRFRDRAARRTLFGPHRSDLSVSFALKGTPAALSSTGEQKALLLSIILAEAELVARVAGMNPILLLDEVAAHLDAGRRAALLARLRDLGCQSFLTGTDRALFESAGQEGQFVEVADGRLGSA
ncbi:DNA replication/repair protein RecF [Afifella sp. IM 167]|uniref:DNA replication/repair protein RecF n=1 Tax=Afifella sp. IM 167 TaxID=2033586 RepID=UPI001CCB11BF|nr:DNA replication/repair protein RecF [Afifella sp. IM 167]MBZ8132967.1 DNA replication/repair protein RecF [Afifella sp. IM 167]